ncbi:hypothetical protein F4808DRAFT_282010 [Astrocystis sublimbata]|nr:hypothetical protein F4808DRAFT_282010 [Astrocystis sublimbata]
MPSLRTTLTLLASGTTVLGVVIPVIIPQIPTTTTCVEGTPTTTAGYPMLFYVPATPSPDSFQSGYRPESGWAGEHLVGSYTFGASSPAETGGVFAYVQYKCQYYCKNGVGGGSFFVEGGNCQCYDDLLDPGTFVDNNQTLVGAWNAMCGA